MQRQGGAATHAMERTLAEDACIDLDKPLLAHESEYKDTFHDIVDLWVLALKKPFQWRISRGEYLVWSMIVQVLFLLPYFLLVLLSHGLGETNAWVVIFALIQFLFVVCLAGVIVLWSSLAAKRFQDMNKSWWMVLALALLVPFYNIYLMVTLVFKKWDDGENQYGDDPLPKQPTTNTRYSVFACISIGIAMMYVLSESGSQDQGQRAEMRDEKIVEHVFQEDIFADENFQEFCIGMWGSYQLKDDGGWSCLFEME